MAKEIPVYLLTGFMDSGKTTVINQTLYGSEFATDGSSKLLIVCEDGDEEYDEAKLKTVNAVMVTIDKEEDFTSENLAKLNAVYNPDTVFIEFNGTWSVTKMYEMAKPEGWFLAQSICTIDSTTFELYQTNMRQMMNDQFSFAELVIFNRCDDSKKRTKFRGAVKAINRPATVIYEKSDGTFDDSEEELPFDLDAEVIEITDADYALWYMDCMDNPKKYDGKTVHFLGLVYRPEDGKLKRNVFVPGRFAMTCCADDIQFLGMKCKYDEAYSLPHRSFVDFTGSIKYEFTKEYRGMGPVLYAKNVEPAAKPDDELVYFS